jgi:hypothetical protein
VRALGRSITETEIMAKRRNDILHLIREAGLVTFQVLGVARIA